jgi:hypothetical protein
MPIALVAQSACSENQREVAGVDGGTPVVPGSSEPLRCEYQDKLYDSGQARPDDCSCFCDGKTVIFEPLWQAMDTAIAAGFPLVSLTDTGGTGL